MVMIDTMRGNTKPPAQLGIHCMASEAVVFVIGKIDAG